MLPPLMQADRAGRVWTEAQRARQRLAVLDHHEQ
jgi:hypothetical protein